MALSERCRDRLKNWKFEQAVRTLAADDTSVEATLVKTLAEMYGDCGWLDGQVGELIGDTVAVLLQEPRE